MKKRIILLSTFVLMITGLISAQVCPPSSNNGWSSRSTSFYTSASSNGNYTMNRLVDSFNYTMTQGYRLGKLTQSEVWNLERDFERLYREMKWVYTDGRVTFHERSMIDMYLDRLERNISRQWNDNEIRLG